MKFIFKSFLFAILFMGFHGVIFCQDTTTVYRWIVSSKKISDSSYTLTFTTDGNKAWELYEPNQVLSDVAVSEIKFPDSSIISAGRFVARAAKVSTGDSKIFEMPVTTFEGNTSFAITIIVHGKIPAQLQGELSYSYGRNEEFYQGSYEFSAALEGGIEASTQINIPSIDLNKPASSCGDDGTANKSLLTIFLLGLGGGLLALLTPCIFPMIPVTVTFFTKKSGERKVAIRNGVIYGFFIFLIYIAITLPFHIASKSISPEIFNNISTNVGLNIFFFAVFVFFALSFFGFYEIGLPSGFANKIDSKSGLGNIGGIFFMAATLAIVSFSCTGPILGTLLVGVADQGAWPLTAGAAGFGVALGLPFALFAMFPNWLQSLPKSGGWMTDVKVILGFLELALAIKFLSNADLVKQWGVLKREIFIALWIIIATLMVLYLLGILKVKYSSHIKKWSGVRIGFITLFAGTTLYLATGLFFPRKFSMDLFSGFFPPRTYSLFNQDVKGVKPLHNVYDEALRRSVAENKPVLIDFTGWACVNCRRMEEKVWPDPLVDSLMRTKFIVVSLYVDEKNNLPLTEQSTVTLSNGEQKRIISVGDKWSTFQTENFGATSQPQYAIITGDQRLLTKTKYYTPNADEFAQWLKCGLAAFEKSGN